MKLNPELFWDIALEGLDEDKHARFIIERVLTRGNLDDWFAIRNQYGIQRIKHEIRRIRSIDKLTLNFLSLIFEIPKSEFRCSTLDPSIQKLWNY